MPRRKQDCPKRMKWELEQAAAAAAAAARGEGSALDLLAKLKREDSGSEDISDDADNASVSTGSPGPPVRPMDVDEEDESDSNMSSPGHSPSPRNGAPAPVSPAAVLDFSRRSSRRAKHRDAPRGASSRIEEQLMPASIPGDSPLDLSVGLVKKPHHLDESPPKKLFKSSPSWNGRHPSTSPDMTVKALEKMSEMGRVNPAALAAAAAAAAADGRLTSPVSRSSSSSSWQAQWLAQSSCGTRDVLRCVCCRLTFPSLAALSAHMKEAKHGPPLPNLPSPKGSAAAAPGVLSPPSSLPPSNNNSSSSSHDSQLLLKESVQLPRKLVRGQDVWLGKGAEQTRQILKCMWCGQSFRSLAEMTTHMQQTQHYTNIISQEQLISWRSSEDKASSTNSHVSAVLTCKVCDQAFSSLKELSNHMVKNSHYKEHIMRSITESGSRRRQSREKRKKSLPVRKLLELERANTDVKTKEIRISCEKCNEKIPAPAFVDHLRICEAKMMGLMNHHQAIPNSLKSPQRMNHHQSHHHQQQKGKDSPDPPQDLSSSSNHSNSNHKDQQEEGGKPKEQNKDSSSVLNAIEKMIEKSFDYRAKSGGAGGAHSQGNHPAATPPIGSSILKRLGIDESVDYTKPLMDPSVMPIPPRYPSSRPRSVSSEQSDDTGKLPRATPSPCNSIGNHSEAGSRAADRASLKDEDIKSPKNLTVAKSPLSDKASDEASDREDTIAASSPRSARTTTPPTSKSPAKVSSLSALSSMFESIGGGGNNNHDAKSPGGNSSSGGSNFAASGTGVGSHHPLAALQKLCDKTENTTPAVSSRPTSTSSSNPVSSPGLETSSLLGLNWAVSDGENVFKCTFCETPFLSKGAYRHHLAKMHFIKEKSPTNSTKDEIPPDSPASKFMKYTELAKQLSSK